MKRRLAPPSLRARLLVGVFAVAAACLVALAAVTYVQQRDFLEQRVDDQVVQAVEVIGRVLDNEGVATAGVPLLPGERLRRLRPGGPRGSGFPPPGLPGRRPGGGGRGGPPVSLPPGVYGERRAADGTSLGSAVLTYGQAAPAAPDLPDDMPLDRTITVSAQGDDLRYRARATVRPGSEITTIVAVPLAGVDEQLDELLVVEIAVVGGGLLVILALGWWVIRLALRPLDAMTETAGRIAAGDLSQRISTTDEHTEIGRLGSALNVMLHRIEEAFDERARSEDRLRRFLSDASHELRTPLSSIRGYAELYRMGAASDAAGTEKAMGRIEQEASRMGVLVEDLLALARLDEVRDVERTHVDVGELVRDAAGDARASAPDRDVALRLGDDDLGVLAAGDQLRQVLANLVRNALVHTPPGTALELAARRDGGSVVIEVRDHGPGLPDGAADVLFDRFWRADADRGRKSGPAGAGLGLAIVRAIVDAHGGRVTAQGAEGGGARFVVTLPGAG